MHNDISGNGAGADGSRGGPGSARPRRLSRPRHGVDASEHTPGVQAPRHLGPLRAVRRGDEASIRVPIWRGVSRRSGATSGVGDGFWPMGGATVRSRRFCSFSGPGRFLFNISSHLCDICQGLIKNWAAVFLLSLPFFFFSPLQLALCRRLSVDRTNNLHLPLFFVVAIFFILNMEKLFLPFLHRAWRRLFHQTNH